QQRCPNVTRHGAVLLSSNPSRLQNHKAIKAAVISSEEKCRHARGLALGRRASHDRSGKGNQPRGGVMLETTIAGSLPKPAWLAEPEKLWPAWRHEGAALERAKRDAALVWLKEQETAGIDIVSDGEQFRVHFVHGFLERIEGIDWTKKTKMGIRADRYVVDVPTVTAPVRRPAPVHGAEARFTRAYTERKLKFTLPGPMTICDTIADAHYGRRADMAMAFAELLNQEARELEAAGVDVIQFDEPAFNVFLDEVKDWGIDALHRAIEGLECKTAVHICYGYGIE